MGERNVTIMVPTKEMYSTETGIVDKNYCQVFLKFVGMYWKSVFLICWPICCLTIFFLGWDKKFRCMFVVLLMAGYWVTECVPLYITGLLPVALMPMLEIVGSKAICSQYMNSTNMLFMAGIILSLAIENCGLHVRIALFTIICLGCSPRNLHLGLTLATTFVSLWLANVAAAAMMVPIIKGILEELEKANALLVHEPPNPKYPFGQRRPSTIAKCLYLSTAFSASIGGIGTMIGTGTNLTFKGLIAGHFPEARHLDFFSWALISIPMVILMSTMTWIFLQVAFMGLFRPSSKEAEMVRHVNEQYDLIQNVIRDKLHTIGPLSWHEVSVMFLFTWCCAMWIFRDPYPLPGWTSSYPEGYITDACFPYIIIFLLLALPATCNWYHFCTKEKINRPVRNAKPLLGWDVINRDLPWGFLFLMGGGFALSYAGKVSGMWQYLGDNLAGLNKLPFWLILIVVTFITLVTTELVSNIALCNIIIPIVMEMSVSMKVHPLLFTYPTALCCSFAFCLPAGTPANAVVVSVSHIKIIDMAKYGVFVKLICWLVVLCVFPLYGTLFFDLYEN